MPIRRRDVDIGAVAGEYGFEAAQILNGLHSNRRRLPAKLFINGRQCNLPGEEFRLISKEECSLNVQVVVRSAPRRAVRKSVNDRDAPPEQFGLPVTHHGLRVFGKRPRQLNNKYGALVGGDVGFFEPASQFVFRQLIQPSPAKFVIKRLIQRQLVLTRRPPGASDRRDKDNCRQQNGQ